MTDVLKLNYDDFYKFLVSAGVAFALVCSAVSVYFFAYHNGSWLGLLSGGVYLGLAGAGVAGIIFGLIKWYENQKLLDKKLRLDVGITDLEYKERNYRYRIMAYELDPKNPITYKGQTFPRIAESESERKGE